MASPEATRLLGIARRDLKMARHLLGPRLRKQLGLGCPAMWKTLKAWLYVTGVKPQPPVTLPACFFC